MLIADLHTLGGDEAIRKTGVLLPHPHRLVAKRHIIRQLPFHRPPGGKIVPKAQLACRLADHFLKTVAGELDKGVVDLGEDEIAQAGYRCRRRREPE